MNDHQRPRRRSKAELDALADGSDDGSELAAVLGEMKHASQRVAPTAPNRMLTEFVSTPGLPSETAPSTPRTKSMLTTIIATVGTSAGKLVLAGSAAAAVVTGAIVMDSVPFAPQQSTEVIAAGTDGSSSTTTNRTSDSSQTTQTTSTSQTSQTSQTDTSTSSNDTNSSSGNPSGPAVDAPAQVIQVLDGGSITVAVENGVPVLIDTQPNDGWTVNDEGSTFGAIDLAFRRGSDRIDVDVEVEDGAVRVRIRDRRTDTESETGLDGAPFAGSDDDSGSSSSGSDDNDSDDPDHDDPDQDDGDDSEDPDDENDDSDPDDDSDSDDDDE